jgi:hypothetical protein
MAHIRSILPQKSGVSPVDSNTIALFHYDEHVNDNIKGLKVVGNQTAFYFDGSTRVDTGFSTDNMAQLTVECWFYPARNATETLISSAEGAGISLEFLSSKPSISVNTGGSYKVGTSPDAVSLNTWHHVAATYDGSNVRLYVDGILKQTVACTGTVTASSQKISLGTNPPGNSSNFQGRMSNARIWNVALGASQITDIMYNKLTDGIVAHWKMDEGQGTVIRDYSKSGNDGITTGTSSWLEGQAIYSLVSSGYSGGTGKGVLLEEGTTNLVPNPSFELWSSGMPTNWTKSSTTTITQVAGRTGGYAVRYTATDAGNTGTNRLSVNPGLVASKTYTLSYYARRISGTGTISIAIDSTAGGIATSNGITSEWQQFIGTVTTLTGTSSGMAFYINTANDVFEIDDVQIEEKSRVTSFVSGTRSTGKLEYAIDISGDFTIGLYYKSSVTSGYQVDRTIFALTNGTNVFNFFNGWGNDWFMGDETTRTRFSLNNHTVSSTAYEYLVIVRQGTVYNLYRGQKGL